MFFATEKSSQCNKVLSVRCILWPLKLQYSSTSSSAPASGNKCPLGNEVLEAFQESIPAVQVFLSVCVSPSISTLGLGLTLSALAFYPTARVALATTASSSALAALRADSLLLTLIHFSSKRQLLHFQLMTTILKETKLY